MIPLLWVLLFCLGIVVGIYVLTWPFLALERQMNWPGGTGIILFIVLIGILASFTDVLANFIGGLQGIAVP